MLTSRYQVPKRRVSARVTGADFVDEQVTLFLLDTAETHAGCERPSDLLNGPADFIVVERADGEVTFLNRRRILRVTVALDEEISGEDEELVGLVEETKTDIAVRAQLDGGVVVEGVAHYALPEANRRIQDFLNDDHEFVAFRRENEMDLVNKNHITHVVQLQR